MPLHLINDWKKKLGSANDIDNKGFLGVAQEMNSKDSVFVNEALREMENPGSVNHYYNARLFVLKSNKVYRFYHPGGGPLLKQYFERALNEAYRTGDEYFISLICQRYAELMYAYQEIELSATYYLRAEEINEHLGKKIKNSFGLGLQLGEVLFHTREYRKSIYYLRRGLDNWNDTSAVSDHYRIKFWNAIGQSFQQLGQLDSALINYERSMQIANKTGDTVWMGINSGFTGQVFFLRREYDKAKALLGYAYGINKINEWNIAGYTLQWLAKINLIQGRKDSALLQVKEALNFLNKSNSFPFQKASFLEHIYHTTADVYGAKGNMDSFYYYFQLYSALHDSLERVAVRSSLEIAQMRIDNETNYQIIQSLQQEKRSEELKRNFIIATIILLSIIVFLYVNRLRLKHQHQEQLTLQEKKAAEAEVAAAREQLRLFTQNIVEKANLIEKLERQVQHEELNTEQQMMITGLSRQTILTEDDWQRFKTIFEKIYPGFFTRLKEKAFYITVAEQRMAALTRLHLTTKQIASMLGISVDSVHKTRQRVRRRLNLTMEINLEESITSL